MHTMLCLNFFRRASPCAIFNGVFPPPAAFFRRTTSDLSTFTSLGRPWEICCPEQYLSCLPLQRLSLLPSHFQGHSAQHSTQKGIYNRSGPSQSALLPSRLAPVRISPLFPNSPFTQSSIKSWLVQKPPYWRSNATAYDPNTSLLQPLDTLCRRQSMRRGFALSLPIIIIYLLLYLLNFVPQDSKLGQHYTSTVARFWTYRRHESFQNVANLITYVTSQFTHNRLIGLVADSLVLVGVASILCPFFNRRMFFAVYVLGGFHAAAADCAWAQITNPCRNLTLAQRNQIHTACRLINAAFAKSLDSLPDMEESIKQLQVIDKYYTSIRDWVSWSRPNWAASGFLVCLLSVATLLRPLTIIKVMGIGPSVLLRQFTAYIFVWNLCTPLMTISSMNHQVCIGGNVAAIVLWLLWLRKGRTGSLASGLRAFDKWNKPAGRVSWPQILAGSISYALWIAFWHTPTLLGALAAIVQELKAARVRKSPQCANGTAENQPGEPKRDVANEEEPQEETPANQPAARDHDKAPGNEKD